MLARYSDLIETVDRLGFLPMVPVVPGFPCMRTLTPRELWHTGDPETDPWQWKDRAAEEKKLAFGCLLGGGKGFISKRLYPVFYAACHPRRSLEDQWYSGNLKPVYWKLWRLFDQKERLTTDEIRRGLGVSHSRGASRADEAVAELERTFFITNAGNRRKINQAGLPYGWPANLYEKVTTWAPADWLEGWASLRPEQAAEMILDEGEAICPGLDREELAKKLRLP